VGTDPPDLIRWFADIGSDDVPAVGGKNASLGEMIDALSGRGIRVPDGFAVTAAAYRGFVDANDLDTEIRDRIAAWDEGTASLEDTGRAIRRRFLRAAVPEDLEEAIREAYRELSTRHDVARVDVAVRSSATAEDLPEASFAGQQETVLNVVGEDDLVDACRTCFASLFTDRAISYRDSQGFDHLDVALSVGVQKMVRSDRAGAGVMFTIDTETGFPDVVVIDAAWGLGESVVQGSVNPDEYRVFTPLLEGEGEHRPIIEKTLGDKAHKVVYSTKGGSAPTKTVETSAKERRRFVLDDDEILLLARWGRAIEDHYGRPMDVEWAKDGDSGAISVVQARPETVQSQAGTGALRSYRLEEDGARVVEGHAIGSAIATGEVIVLEDAGEMDRFEDGAILVTGMTDPDWVPVMERAAAIVTDHGGRTSHAAIVSRELGIPAIVGTGDATTELSDGSGVTVSCAEGETGVVYDGELAFESTRIDLTDLPETRTQIMMIIASPAAAFRWWRLPVRGVGLARMEFIINTAIEIHPMALVRFDDLEDGDARRTIEDLTRGYPDKSEYFVDHLSRGIARIAASQYPDPVIVRMSDFKTNEYADLIGGAEFEQDEENPMLGFRGASRYTSPRYEEGFALECSAIERVRGEMGFDNVIVMIPFCRTLDEADRVLETLADHGLERGTAGLEVYVMCEVPSNIVLAEEFAERFDGFSIGSNDLTQLLLGVDRDSAALADLFDERDPAVVAGIRDVIERAHDAGRPVGICGQAPSDHPGFAAMLVDAGIDSISLNPDSVVEVVRRVAERERERGR
jgi:pyruvate, water dikinase